MNAGDRSDAMNLSWMLAAHLQGVGCPRRSSMPTRAERHPTTEEVSRFVAKHAASAISERTTLPSQYRGELRRRRQNRAPGVGRAAFDLHVQQFACAGLNYGYCYRESPIVVHDGEAPPPYTMRDYVPSTVPGCRTPHLWLKDGRSLYDAMGPNFTLLRFDPHVSVDALMAAAARRDVPLDVAGCRPSRHAAAVPPRVAAQPSGLSRRLARRCQFLRIRAA